MTPSAILLLAILSGNSAIAANVFERIDEILDGMANEDAVEDGSGSNRDGGTRNAH